MKDLTIRILLFALLWWIVTEGNPRTVWLGALAVAAAVWASRRLLPASAARWRPWPLLRLAGYFGWQSIRAGTEVALLAMRSRDALHPGLQQLRVTLPAGAPRLLLVNLIGLMPGTLCASLDGEMLLLHVLDQRMSAKDAVAELEARIAAVTGDPR